MNQCIVHPRDVHQCIQRQNPSCFSNFLEKTQENVVQKRSTTRANAQSAVMNFQYFSLFFPIFAYFSPDGGLFSSLFFENAKKTKNRSYFKLAFGGPYFRAHCTTASTAGSSC